MRWTIAEAARRAGVTSRTLRHYEQVGLLFPSCTGANGYRYYDEPQLRRLQRILLLRELGVGLAAIRAVLDDHADEAALLRRHREALRAERDRLDRLAGLVDRTLEEMDGGPPMRPEDLFDGFDAARQQRYEDELVERYGDGVRDRIDESWRRIGRMSKDDAVAVQAELSKLDRAYATLMAAGVEPADPRVQDVTAAHYRWVCRFWTPDADAFASLGDLYVENPEFKARYDAVATGLAEYVRDAMAVYAVQTLA